jgi:hypothetical protein
MCESDGCVHMSRNAKETMDVPAVQQQRVWGYDDYLNGILAILEQTLAYVYPQHLAACYLPKDTAATDGLAQR